MEAQHFGSVAALLFSTPPHITFPAIVVEVEAALLNGRIQRHSLTWDSEHVAVLDLDLVRVTLSLSQHRHGGEPWYLLIAVGPGPRAMPGEISPEVCERLARRIAQGLDAELGSDTLVRRDAPQPVGPDAIEHVLTELESLAGGVVTTGFDRDPAMFYEPFGHEQPVKAPSSDEEVAAEATRAERLCGTSAADHREDLLEAFEAAEMQEEDSREVIDVTGRDKPASAPMRLGIYTLGYSLLLQVPLVGLILLTYTLLNEEPVAQLLSTRLFG